MSIGKWEKKIFIVRTLLFFCGFIFLFFIVNRIFLYKDNNFYNYINYMQQQGNSVDVLVMGSSHSIDAVDSLELGAVLEEEYGIRAGVFNMSITGMRIEQIAYRLQEAVKTQQPRLLIVETFSFVPMELSNEEMVRRYAADYMPLSLEKVGYIRNRIGEGAESFYVPFIKYHTRWEELGKDDFRSLSKKWLKDISSPYGVTVGAKPEYEGERDDYFQQDFTSISECREISDEQKEDVEAILETAKKNQMKVLFLSVPYKKQMDVPSTELIKYNNYIREMYVDDENVFLLDMNLLMNGLGWGYEYMQDDGHVNDAGRKEVMDCLAKYIGTSLGEEWF